MAQLPMIPGWDGIHPLLIHFPLSLFFLAPVFVLFASLTKATTRRTFLISALTVMFLGITLTYAAFAAGQAAAASVTRSEEVRAIRWNEGSTTIAHKIYKSLQPWRSSLTCRKN